MSPEKEIRVRQGPVNAGSRTPPIARAYTTKHKVRGIMSANLLHPSDMADRT